ncbi:MAG: hypothetical protein WCP57_10720 [Bacteroidota bacterium]
MNQFGIIIQETTAGSNQQFVSTHLDINTPEIKGTITDERTLASQLANLSDVYSVQVTKNYKVYSLIVTNSTDFIGRSGYYAIRLYGPKGINLTNFEIILANIKEKYNHYTKMNTLKNQSYEDILSSIILEGKDRNNIVSIKSAMSYFYYFDDANSNLGTIFNTNVVHMVYKIYAFNKNKAVDESIALTAGLKSFSQINTSQKEISMNNNWGLLNDLKINDQSIDFNPNLTEFNIICQNNDVVLYNTNDDKTYKTINNNFISIEKKFIAPPGPPKTPPGSGPRPDSDNPNTMYIILGLMVLLIGGGIFYILRPDQPRVVILDDEPTNVHDTKHKDTISRTFDINVQSYKNSRDSTYRFLNYPPLKDLIFVFTKEKWSYRKSNETNWIFFYRNTLDVYNLSRKDKGSIIQKLEVKSGHVINEREEKKEDNNKTERNKVDNTTKKKDTTKQSSKSEENKEVKLIGDQKLTDNPK